MVRYVRETSVQMQRAGWNGALAMEKEEEKKEDREGHGRGVASPYERYPIVNLRNAQCGFHHELILASDLT